MLDHNAIFDLKNKYGKIYSVNIKEIPLIFRELTFSEYGKIVYFQESDEFSSADIEDYILQSAIVYPEGFDIYQIPAGTVSLLAEEILDLSGFYSAGLAKAIMEEKREEANQVKNLMKAFVLATISTYSPEDLEEMTFSQLSEKVALAEKIIEIKQGMNGLESNELRLQLIDPEEEAQKAKDFSERYDKAKPTGAAGIQDPIAQKLWGLQ